MRLDRNRAPMAKKGAICIAVIQIVEILKYFMGNRLTVGLTIEAHRFEVIRRGDTNHSQNSAGNRRLAPRFVSLTFGAEVVLRAPHLNATASGNGPGGIREREDAQ